MKEHIQTTRFTLEERSLDDLKHYLRLDRSAQKQFSGINDEERLLKDLKWAYRKVYQDEYNWRIWYIIQDGLVLGNLGFHNISLKDKRAEIGYALHPEFRRKGYMKEATQSLLDWAQKKELFVRIEAFIAPDNAASLNLISRLNFKREAVLRSHHLYDDVIHDSVVYALFP